MDPLQAGIAAARQGNRAEARAWLQEAIRLDAASEQAWLWLSTVVETDAEHRLCLERALAINPQNETTRARLEDIARSGRGSAGRVPIERLSPRPAQRPAKPAVPVGASPPVVSSVGRTRSEPRPARRLPPHLVSPEPPASQPHAEDVPPVPSAPGQSARPDRTAALAAMGCLSVTAVSGLLVLVVLLLMGWAS